MDISEVFEELVGLLNPQLNSCQFCGCPQGKIVCWINESVYVECERCRGRGPVVVVPEEQAGPKGVGRLADTVLKAMQRWNNLYKKGE